MSAGRLLLVVTLLVTHSCLSVSAIAESGTKSADEVAKELTNPNNSLAKLTFKNQFRWYTGDLPGADDEFNYSLLFQPVFPFALGQTPNGGNAVLFARPAIPLLFDQPTFDASDLDFDGVTAMGDIDFDLAYGVTEKNGFLWALGMVGTLPTATDSDVAGKTPLKVELELNYYFEQPDAFGLEWMIGLNLTPIIPNFVEQWVRGL